VGIEEILSTVGPEEVAVMTPTILRLKSEQERPTWKNPAQPYAFYLTETELRRLLEAKVGMGPVVVFALIRSAVRAARGRDWVTLRLRVRESVSRNYRWWHAVTQKLEVAGFIECERHKGRLPRYRLVRDSRAHLVSQG
jgi:hypothetical protein